MSRRAGATPLLAAGIDVGGTKTSLIVSDPHDRLLLHETVSTEPDDLAGQVIRLLGRAIAKLEADGLALSAAGVAVPGRVQPFEGTVALAVNLGTPSLPLARLVEDATGLPTFVEHDARAAVSWLRDSSRPTDRQLAYLSVGTGISAGVVIGGELLRGVGGLAGEFGHTLAQPGGPLCSCGLTGCLEAVAAGPAIARQVQQALAAGRDSSLKAQTSSAEVFAAAAQGDPLATEIADAAAGHLARAVRALVLIFGLERVVIGGGVAAAGAVLLDRVLAQLALEREASPLVEAAFKSVRLEIVPPSQEVGARGAAAIARAAARARASRGHDEQVVRQGEGVGGR